MLWLRFLRRCLGVHPTRNEKLISCLKPSDGKPSRIVLPSSSYIYESSPSIAHQCPPFQRPCGQIDVRIDGHLVRHTDLGRRKHRTAVDSWRQAHYLLNCERVSEISYGFSWMSAFIIRRLDQAYSHDFRLALSNVQGNEPRGGQGRVL